MPASPSVGVRYCVFTLACCLAAAGCVAVKAPSSASPVPSVIIGPGEDAASVLVIAAPGGDVALATRKDKELMYDQYTYSAARRAGDFVFLSGVVAGPLPGEGNDLAAFRAQLARAFGTIRRNLEVAGATMADVVEIESYHVMEGPNFRGTFDEQLAAVLEAKKQFVPEPHPTWTVLGVAGLADPYGVVEIKVTAYTPRNR